MTYDELEKVSVHDVVKLVAAEGTKILAEARKLTTTEDVVARQLYYFVAEPLARLRRRVDSTRGKDLESTHRLRYRAAIVLSPDQAWQAKVPNLGDVVDETDKILAKGVGSHGSVEA